MRILALICLLFVAPGCITHSLSEEDRQRVDMMRVEFRSIDEKLGLIAKHAEQLEKEVHGVRKATTDLSRQLSPMFGKPTSKD